MLLKTKIASSSIAEVVIAVSVIALCFGMASMVFVRSTMVTTSYEEIREQTLLQSLVWKQLHHPFEPVDFGEFISTSEDDLNNDSLVVLSWEGTRPTILWTQQFIAIE